MEIFYSVSYAQRLTPPSLPLLNQETGLWYAMSSASLVLCDSSSVVVLGGATPIGVGSAPAEAQLHAG